MLKTEWKEDFVYKPKELLQLFQSLPSAKMRMRTKIIVQVRITRNHLFFPIGILQEVLQDYARIPLKSTLVLFSVELLSKNSWKISFGRCLFDNSDRKRSSDNARNSLFLQNYLRKNSTAIYFCRKLMFVSRRIVFRELIKDSFRKMLCLRILMRKAVFDTH